MAMRWRVSAADWHPEQQRLLDRDGAKMVDKEENRIRLCAQSLDAMICVRACMILIEDKLKHMEKMARHVGAWFRFKGCITQLLRIVSKMMDHLALEQLLSVKNNTQHIKLSMCPENLPGDTETYVISQADRERLLCASLAYCQWHCDGCAKNQSRCRIKRLLDESSYMQSCDLPQVDRNQCRYAMADVDWERIRNA